MRPGAEGTRGRTARRRVGPLWRKAPFALRHHPSVLAAVAAATLLVALAAASAPFATTAVASEALKNELRQMSPLAAGLQIRRRGGFVGRGQTVVEGRAAADARAAAVEGVARELGSLGGVVRTLLAPGV